MAFIEQLHQSIDSRLEELRAETNKLEDARKTLSNGSATPAPKVERNGNRSTPRRQQKPKAQVGTQVLLAGQVERILAESADGISTSTIASQGNAAPAQVLTLLREMEKAGQIRRTGERRGTRWHVYTDEDRIQERAAELERTRKPRPRAAGRKKKESL
jgi:predicted Rossmann fold nucleotide-binding protein DprA/Smf involved in DNA uptake